MKSIAFKVSYALMFLYAYFGHIAQLSDILRVLSYLSLAYMAISFFIETKKPFLVVKRILPYIILSLIFIFTSNSFIPLKTVLLVMFSSGIGFDDRIRFDYKLRLVSVVAMVLLSQLGIIPSSTYYFIDGSETIKYDLGFASPNTLGMCIMILCMEAIYIYRNKKYMKTIAVCSIVTGIFYLFSGSRTALIVYILFVLMMIVYKRKINIYNNKILKYLIIFSPIIISIGIVALYYYLYNNIATRQIVDQVSSGRYTNARIYIENFPISVFGTDITITKRTCDVFVIHAIYSFGVVGLITYLLCFMRLLSVLYKDTNNLPLIFIIVSLLIYGIGETLWIYPEYNIFMTAFSALISNEKTLLGNKYGQ